MLGIHRAGLNLVSMCGKRHKYQDSCNCLNEYHTLELPAHLCLFGGEVSSGGTGGGFVSMTSSKAMICTQTQTMIRWQVAGQVSRSCTEVRTGAEALSR